MCLCWLRGTWQQMTSTLEHIVLVNIFCACTLNCTTSDQSVYLIHVVYQLSVSCIVCWKANVFDLRFPCQAVLSCHHNSFYGFIFIRVQSVMLGRVGRWSALWPCHIFSSALQPSPMNGWLRVTYWGHDSCFHILCRGLFFVFNIIREAERSPPCSYKYMYGNHMSLKWFTKHCGVSGTWFVFVVV